MLLHKPFDRSTFVNLGIVEQQQQPAVGKALMELVKKLQEPLRRASGSLLPIAFLGFEVQRPKERCTLALGGAGDFDLLSLPKPAALDRGLVGEVGLIDQEDCDKTLLLDRFYGGNNLCHPGFFFSAVGAFFGRVWAQRL
jgi:hypothetical protein